MAKQIVFCADGTWESPASSTNVYRLYSLLNQNSAQVAFYQTGVGADESGLQHVLEGVFGDGLIAKVKGAYAQVAHSAEQDDLIATVGFSRGAYTARCLAGMLAGCGVPASSGFSDGDVDAIFDAYRDKKNRAAKLAALSTKLMPAHVNAVAVWDTVGALGIPAIFGGIDMDKYGFLDTTLHPDVKFGFHAVSIDEHRKEFTATLWTGAPAAGQAIEQVWFSGCHGDVGGGCSVTGSVDQQTLLSDITLGWMVRKLAAAGISFTDAAAQYQALLPAKCSFDKLHETWQPWFGTPTARSVPQDAKLGNSVGIRWKFDLQYRPPNLANDGDDLADGYGSTDVVASS